MKKFLLFLTLTIAIVAIPVTMYLLTQEQDIRSNADEFDDLDNANLSQNTNTPACQTPEGIQNVSIDFPYCQGNQCFYNQGGCSWDTVPGAANYTVTITKVETSSVVKTETIAGTQTSFPVDSGNTYKCDVAAVNSCGTSGPIASNSLFCEVENFEDSPTPIPTVAPTIPNQPTVVPTIPQQVIVPTTPPVIQPTRAPLPPSGNTETTILVGVGGIALIIIGGLLFAL